MARVLDVDIQRERVRIDFPYDAELVDVVRTLPERSFDGDSKSWFVPLEHLEYVIDRLDDYHFQLSPTLREYRDGREETDTDIHRRSIPDDTWTISELNRNARAALRDRFDDSIWLVGELQSFERNLDNNYRNYFFELVERPKPNAQKVAKIDAVLFERRRQAFIDELKDADLDPKDGMSIRVGGRVDLYPERGSYQFIVEDVDPAYTAGEIELNRERIFAALKKKGIAADNRRLELPVCPLRVGLITSWESDAYNDFVHQLRASERGFSLTVHHASVQGANTESSVLRALEYFEQRADQFDVVAIVRGGGSRSDLAHFDTEAIGEAVCAHPVKIICGIGHQRDTCLLDMICESTKTPTAAASRIVERVEDYVDSVSETFQKIARRVERFVDEHRRRLLKAGTRLERQVLRGVDAERRRQDRLCERVVRSTEVAVGDRRDRIDRIRRQIERQATRRVDERRRRLNTARRDLSVDRLTRRMKRRRKRVRRRLEQLKRGIDRTVDDHRRDLTHLEQRLGLLDPQRVLERGFAIVRGDDGTVRSCDDIPAGGDFDVMLGDGVLQARRIDGETESTTEQHPNPLSEAID